MESQSDTTEKSQVCVTCRNRRVRCDREQPMCGPCGQACVPCTRTHGSTRRQRGQIRPVGATKFDDWAGNASSINPASPSMLQTAVQERVLQFLNISQPLEAGKAENRAKVRSHVMRNFKQKQRACQSPTSNQGHNDTQILLRTIKSSRECNCRSSPAFEGSDAAVPDTDANAAKDHQTLGRSDSGGTSTNYMAMLQLLLASRKSVRRTPAKNDFCGKCGGRRFPDAQKACDIQPFENNQLFLRGDTLDPFDTLRTSTSRIEVRELVYHAVSTLWPSLCPIGIFDPMNEVFGPLVISDELLFQANLFNAGFHLSALRGKRYSTEGMRHRIEMIKLLTKRLRDQQNPVTEITISVVIGLLAQAIIDRNIPEIKVHADGLQKMVALIGGLAQLGLEGLLQELVFWTELCSAVVMNTEPLFAHPTTYRRLTILPIFTAPRCPFSKLGHGFRDMFPPGKAQGIKPFQELLEQLNQVRCLGWVLHISTTCRRPQVALRSFLHRGVLVKQRILALPNLFAAGASIGTANHQGPEIQLFECLRFATLIFCEFVLVAHTRNGPTEHSVLPELDTLKARLFELVQNLDMHKIETRYAGFFFWVFSMGAIASAKEGEQAYFVKLADHAAKVIKVQSWQEAKTAWIRFLAVEVVLEGPLEVLWEEIEKLRKGKLVISQRPRSQAETRTDE